ncbi:hypothetical protein TNCV_4913511 [Trichonephila clavipes]|nr:hypothetical protein TNCV_4913511 [Trichonephila clavipes]
MCESSFSSNSDRDIRGLQQRAKINEAWGSGITSEWTVRSLFTTFRSSIMENDHKPGVGSPVRCNVDNLG